MKTMLNVKNIAVYYGTVPALKGITLDVHEGEFVALLGPNGAGKTTVVKTIMGVFHPRSGKIMFEGRNITREPPHRTVGMGLSLVPEDRLLFPEMTVMENLALGASTLTARSKTADSLKLVFSLFPKLEMRQNQIAGTFSGGEQQMLAIARALMSRPKLLFLDEPSLGLAPIVIKELFQQLQTLSNTGISILLVEQNAVQALKISQRAYVLESGEILSHGSSAEFAHSEIIKSYVGL